MKLTAALFLIALVFPVCTLQAGDTTCAKCHTNEARTQPQTAMARAMLEPGQNPVFRKHPKLTFDLGPYHYTVQQEGGRETYSVSDGKDTITVPILWTFGRDMLTWVLDYNGQRYESLVTYYPAIDALDITVGDNSIRPSNLLEAFGRHIEDTETNACFGCHSSAQVINDKLQLDNITRGVSCSHCHSGAEAHSTSILKGSLAGVPAKLKKLSAEDVSGFCGQCHRTWQMVVTNRWFGVSNVRFQPYRLALSKCFDGVDRRMSCVACHNPHEEVVQNDRTYDARCLACHANAPRQKACPVSRDNCVSCHMPKVQLPGAHRPFTDHFVRVVKPGEPYLDHVAP